MLNFDIDISTNMPKFRDYRSIILKADTSSSVLKKEMSMLNRKVRCRSLEKSTFKV